MTEFVEQLEKLTNADTVKELWDLHTRQMTTYGFDRLMYGYTRYRTQAGLGDPLDWVVLTTQSPDYTRFFVDEGLYEDAPMLKWALANNGAGSWRMMIDRYRLGQMTPTEEKVMEFNKEMDVTAGYTVSFRSVSARVKGAIALTARPGMTQDAVEDVWSQHGCEIVIMNNVMHLKLLTLPHSADRKLTKRQSEVLQWVADGKTTQDIAQLLHLTPATVEKHLRLARAALGVETTAQAVLKMASYNQMFLDDPDVT